VSPLPTPPNARVDGLDARAASLAAFLVDEMGSPSPTAQTSGPAMQILFAARAREARSRRVRRTSGAGVALGALAAAGLVAWTVTSRVPSPAALSYTVDGAAPPRDGYVRSSAAHEPELAFSDGTNIHIMTKARARVLEVGSRGARLVLEDGRAHVHVVHRPGADWQVQAGAFLVHVHGTAFTVGWSASEARFDLQMESGVVSVEGPRSSDTVVLRAGQALSVRPDGSRVVSATLPTPGTRVSSSPAPESSPPPAEATAPLTAPDATPRPVTPRLLPSGAQPRARWSERLADGDAAGIVAEAQRRGVASVLAAGSSEDLAALADAARFQMQDRLARRVLLTQRERFPATLRAKEASFLLGRLADGRGGRASDALAWYDRYLHEAPTGAYAAEAMGRMMMVLERQQRIDEARAVATTYLRRFPQGVYARAARGVTSR
jgi:TolA-binding protein